jgi:hypothetical protein
MAFHGDLLLVIQGVAVGIGFPAVLIKDFAVT